MMNNKSKLIAVLLLLLLVLLSWVLLRRKESLPKNEELGTHRFIESKFHLNSEQSAALPKLDESDKLLIVRRYRDSAGMWRVALGELPRGAVDSKVVGVLHAAPIKGIADVPVYSCQYSVGNKVSLSIDVDPACSLAKGTPQGSAPLGYLSKLIRTGYLLLVRCRTPNQGLYLSLNARCEHPQDQFLDVLGALRAATN